MPREGTSDRRDELVGLIGDWLVAWQLKRWSVYDIADAVLAREATLTAENGRLRERIGSHEFTDWERLNARVAALEALLDTASEYMRIEEAMRWTKDKQAALTPTTPASKCNCDDYHTARFCPVHHPASVLDSRKED